MAEGPPLDLSAVADCGFSADADDPAGRAVGFCTPDSSAGIDVALTALLKCMTGG
jgi:hypothetical protein